MKLILVRHGEAGPGPNDAERMLTQTGRADVSRAARLIAATGWNVVEIVTSPLRRTVETGSLLSLPFASPPPQRAEPGLAPGVELASVASLLGAAPGSDAVIWVFHAPDVQRVAGLFTGLPDSGFYCTPGTILALNLPPQQAIGRSLIIFSLPPEFLRPLDVG